MENTPVSRQNMIETVSATPSTHTVSLSVDQLLLISKKLKHHPHKKQIGFSVSRQTAEEYVSLINQRLNRPENQIDNPWRLANFLTQVIWETSFLSKREEGLDYTAKGIVKTWPKRFSSVKKATPYAHNPAKLANKVYAGPKRMGNGSEQSGDGYRFRGQGDLMNTGRSNFTALTMDSIAKCQVYANNEQLRERCSQDYDYVSHPEFVQRPKDAIEQALWFWRTNKLNDKADQNDVDRISRVVNGGGNGLKERREILAVCEDVLGIAGQPTPIARSSKSNKNHKSSKSLLHTHKHR